MAEVRPPRWAEQATCLGLARVVGKIDLFKIRYLGAHSSGEPADLGSGTLDFSRPAFEFWGTAKRDQKARPDPGDASRSSLTVTDGGRYHPVSLLECERHEPVHPACRPRRHRRGDRRRRRLPRPCAVFPDGAGRCRGGEGHARTHRGRGAAAELRRCRPAGPSRGRPSRHDRAGQGAPGAERPSGQQRGSLLQGFLQSVLRLRGPRRTALGVPAPRAGLGGHHRQARPRPHQFPRHQGRRRDHDPPLRQAGISAVRSSAPIPRRIWRSFASRPTTP